MDYLKFETEHFLTEPTFIEYCKGLDADSVNLWEQWIKDNPSKAHLTRKAKSLYFMLNGNIDQAQLTKNYQRFQDTFQARYSPPVTKRANRLFRNAWTSVAACLIVAVGIYIYTNSVFQKTIKKSSLSYYSPLGHKKSIRLSDGSLVILNGGSRLVLSPGFGQDKREVELQGEGYFKVVHNEGKPFIVNTASIIIKDLGTTFNVKAYPSDRRTEASLIEGVIEVYQRVAGSKGLLIAPKQKYSTENINSQAKTEKSVLARTLPYQVSDLTILPESKGFAETDWTQEKLSFYREPFEDIAKQMERWYNVRIEIRNDRLRKNIFTASFDRQNIVNVLDAFSISANFNYRKEQNVYIIY